MASGPSRYCDLVMKGGITSGIVYPNAVLALAREFRFKNIGGTSAGAIAAAASAAAALGDRRKQAKQIADPDGKAGFEGLTNVAGKLASQGFIFSLFQPASGAGRAYRLLVLLVGNAGKLRKGLAAFLSIPVMAPETLLILGAALAAGAWAAGWKGMALAGVPAFFLAWLAGALLGALRVARVARGNMLGLCSGLSLGAAPALTDWMHGVLQSLSGQPADRPLTFADLWKGPRYPDEPKTTNAIGLQMITTCVSHLEPRTLPFERSHFWFLREEFDRLFPKDVVDWMVAKAGDPKMVGGRAYCRLPAGGDLPVLVAMRMSLSFPLLISAVPLHEPARSAPAAPGAEPAPPSARKAERNVAQTVEALTVGGAAEPATITAFRRCWFSDGGISSNFPIHLFDAPLPLWPTFGIDLLYPQDRNAPPPAYPLSPEQIEKSIWLPLRNDEGWRPSWQQIDGKSAVGELVAFLGGLIGTMQNWRDLLQSRAPGYRDRIVHVCLGGGEGGLNLNMEQKVLDAIAQRGAAAGEELKKFSFDNHYWIRWRNAASALQRYTISIAAADACLPRVAAYESAYATARTGTPAPPSYRFSSAPAREAAEKLLQTLLQRGAEWEDLGPDFSKGAPRPLPQMRIVPTY